MKKRTVIYILLANLVVLGLLVFIYPHLMIAPGPLIAGHQALNTDCFACHTAFAGTPPERCVACHKPDRIGLFTTKGVPIARPAGRAAFHGKLTGKDCLACHSDHAGVMQYRKANGHFSHGLLDAGTRGQCASCHARPVDALHKQATGECSTCHGTERWLPATFDHDKYFPLDQDHNASCGTCHSSGDYRSYTCYGCHEHTPANMRAEHAEEGITNLSDCVRCHRSSSDRHGESGREGGDD